MGEVDLVDVSGGDVLEGAGDNALVVRFVGDREFGWIDGPRGLLGGRACRWIGRGLDALGDDVGEGVGGERYRWFDGGGEVVAEGDEPMTVGRFVVGLVEDGLERVEWRWICGGDEVGVEDLVACGGGLFSGRGEERMMGAGGSLGVGVWVGLGGLGHGGWYVGIGYTGWIQV